jgi:hypothetical protein
MNPPEKSELPYSKRLVKLAGFWVLTLFFLSTVPANAEENAFYFPLACKRGENCWIVNYPDTEPHGNRLKI